MLPASLSLEGGVVVIRKSFRSLVRERNPTTEHACTLLLTEINYHQMTLDGLTAKSDDVLAKIEAANVKAGTGP